MIVGFNLLQLYFEYKVLYIIDLITNENTGSKDIKELFNNK